MVIKVNGKALANGHSEHALANRWEQPRALMGSLTLKDAKAGDPVKLEGVSPPVSFKSLQPTVPVLEFMDASNIQISGVTKVWSGLGKNTWFENMYAWSALLVPVIFLGLKLWDDAADALPLQTVSDIALQAGLQANGDGLRSAPVELDRIALPASFTRVWNLFSAYRCGQVKF